MKTVYHPAYIFLVKRLVSERKKIPMTQTQLAKRLGKQQSYVAKVEGYERKLDILELIEWCNALNQTASKLIQDLEYKFFELDY